VQLGAALGVPEPRTTIGLYRLPSLLGALAAVLLTYWAALAFVSRRAALLAGVMMATCFLLSVEGRLAKTDAMLLAAIVAAMGALARAYLPEQRARKEGSAWTVPAVFWTALAAGVLFKGPVILMVVGLAAVTLAVTDRSLRWLAALHPLAGLAWFAILVLPWFLAIIMRSGESFFAESVGQDLLGKLTRGQESHGAPPGYYLAVFWVTFWPGATLAALATPAVWAARREPGAKFLLAWLLPSWLVFEIVVTKLPHYVLPLFPAIAILIAGVVEQRMLSRSALLARGTMLWFLVPLLTGIAGLILLVVVGRQFGFVVWPVIGAAAFMGLRAWLLYEAADAEHSLLRGAAASVLTSFALFGLVVPALAPVFPSTTLVKVMRESGCAAPRAAAAGYHEPSLVFLAGTDTVLTDAAGAADFLRGGACRFGFIDARLELSFAQRADAIGLNYAKGPRIEIFNIGSGRWTTIAVYRSGAAS
jgi:4-amino-4-deoxy-L-arabinose transferase-like glycosyltransferase